MASEAVAHSILVCGHHWSFWRGLHLVYELVGPTLINVPTPGQCRVE